DEARTVSRGESSSRHFSRATQHRVAAMEPDTLATPGDDWTGRATLPAPTPPASGPTNGHAGPASPSAAPRTETNGGNGAAAPATNGHGGHLNQGGARGSVGGEPASTATMSAASAALAVESDRRTAQSFYLRTGKRLLDLVGAALALVVTSPILLLAALAIKLESRGPVFYRSIRLGRGGRP